MPQEDRPLPAPPQRVKLKRVLTLPMVTLYGLGVTIGAGIYVLVGATAERAAIYAPISFVVAAVVVAFSGLSYAELAVRYPVSAGAAAYVRRGLRLPWLALVVGLMIIVSGIVSAAAIAIGAAEYLRHFVPLSLPLVTGLVVLAMGVVAMWGILESVLLAAICTAIEIFGLLLVIAFGVALRPELLGELHRILPPFSADAWAGIASASLLAFFAFIGFEDIVNVAEEVRQPHRTLPRAIVATLLIATVLYVAVVSVVTLAVPAEALHGSAAPLALVFQSAGGHVGVIFMAIAVFATVNGVLVQMIMASRVLYGLAAQGSLPSMLGVPLAHISPLTRTPVPATAVVVVAIAVLAVAFPISGLAELTSQIVLAAFALVNLSLVCIKLRGETHDGFRVPLLVPIVGAMTSAALLAVGLLPFGL